MKRRKLIKTKVKIDSGKSGADKFEVKKLKAKDFMNIALKEREYIKRIRIYTNGDVRIALVTPHELYRYAPKTKEEAIKLVNELMSLLVGEVSPEELNVK